MAAARHWLRVTYPSSAILDVLREADAAWTAMWVFMAGASPAPPPSFLPDHFAAPSARAVWAEGVCCAWPTLRLWALEAPYLLPALRDWARIPLGSCADDFIHSRLPSPQDRAALRAARARTNTFWVVATRRTPFFRPSRILSSRAAASLHAAMIIGSCPLRALIPHPGSDPPACPSCGLSSPPSLHVFGCRLSTTDFTARHNRATHWLTSLASAVGLHASLWNKPITRASSLRPADARIFGLHRYPQGLCVDPTLYSSSQDPDALEAAKVSKYEPLFRSLPGTGFLPIAATADGLLGMGATRFRRLLTPSLAALRSFTGEPSATASHDLQAAIAAVFAEAFTLSALATSRPSGLSVSCSAPSPGGTTPLPSAPPLSPSSFPPSACPRAPVFSCGPPIGSVAPPSLSIPPARPPLLSPAPHAPFLSQFPTGRSSSLPPPSLSPACGRVRWLI
jgi:hypothetical protein